MRFCIDVYEIICIIDAFFRFKNTSTTCQAASDAILDPGQDSTAVPSTSRNISHTQNSSISETIEAVISKYCTLLDEDEKSDEEKQVSTWSAVTGASLKKFNFLVDAVGPIDAIRESYLDRSPVEFFYIFFNDDVIDLIVTETNRYAQQKINAGIQQKSRLHRWKDTDAEEIKTFFAISLWMGLARFPKIVDYWRKNMLYSNKISEKMSRNRFELLLRTLHFSNNEDAIANDRLAKLGPLLKLLTDKFRKVYIPEREVCIDETLVPFRGRLLFKQYIKNKRHKFGIKLYKICCKGGYTFDLKVYVGNDKDPNISASSKIVLQLMEPLLHQGRILYTDNYYTSITLAHELLKRETHIVGTLRSNRKLNPEEVTKKKLKKSEIIARECEGVVVLKWQDKREVLCLSTCHTANTIKIKRRNDEIDKPVLICDYNNSKSFIDLSDQLKAYATPLRKGIKWYRKLAFELLLGTSLVNAYVLYKIVTKGDISITAFKEKVVESILNLDILQEEDETELHLLDEVGSKDRRRCVICYEKIYENEGRKSAQLKTRKSKFCCRQCKKFYCLTCFFAVHKYKK